MPGAVSGVMHPFCAASYMSLDVFHHQISVQLRVENVSAGQPLDGFMIQLNKNSLGLVPQTQTIAVGQGKGGWG